MQKSTSWALRAARRVSAVAAVALAVSTPSLVSSQTVNFNTLSYGSTCAYGGGPQIANGYAGFGWAGFGVLDMANFYGAAPGCDRQNAPASSIPQPLPNSGYYNLNRTNIVALGSSSAYLNRSTAFTLSSFVAGAGWQDHTTLTLEFYLNTVLMKTTTYDLRVGMNETNIITSGLYAGATDFIRFTPNYDNATDVYNTLAESCGVPAGVDCTPQKYKTFFVDNLIFADAPATVVTPEPSTIGLMSLGLIAAGFAARKRRKA